MISASIVLYQNDQPQLLQAIQSILRTTDVKQLYLIDNSPNDSLKTLASLDPRIVYVFNNSNLGFGAGHNIALNSAIKNDCVYHFIVNPDTYFDRPVILPMVMYMQSHADVAMMMPEILYPDGSIQYLPKLLPSPGSILLRILKKPVGIYQRFINKYELRFVPRNLTYNAPVLSGCFTLLNLNIIKETGGYDDTFFMYFEDWDLSRRLHKKYQTVYYPLVSVYHSYEAGARKGRKLFLVFIKSAYTYFGKWGWMFDTERKLTNERTIEKLQHYLKSR